MGRSRRADPDDEGGAGLLSTMWGLLFLLGFLLIVVQVAADLYWQSQVRLVTFDAARRAAESGSGGTGQGEAIVDQLLGGGATTSWAAGADAVTLTVSVPRSSPIVRIWNDDPYTATVTVRRERFREPEAT